MTEPTKINDQLSVAAQISLDDLAAFKAAGYTTIINNRPDNEEPGQLDHVRAEAEAKGRREAEERERREAALRARAEADAQARREAEEKSRRKAKRKAEDKDRREAAEQELSGDRPAETLPLYAWVNAARAEPADDADADWPRALLEPQKRNGSDAD